MRKYRLNNVIWPTKAYISAIVSKCRMKYELWSIAVRISRYRSFSRMNIA